jgi:hypothetical protein
MSYVIYHKDTTRIYKNRYFKTEAAAKAARTRSKLDAEQYAISEANLFFDFIENTVVKVNAMTGQTYRERANTPDCCSPASETYWSM